MSKFTYSNVEKRHFLLLGSQMETGGAQHNLLSQALWFHQQGYRVTVAFLYDKEGLHAVWQQRYPFPIIDLQARRWGAGKFRNGFMFLSGLLRAYSMMKSEHFDAIETFTHHASLAGIPLAWLAGIPVRVANHRGRFKTLSKMQEKLHTYMTNSRMTTAVTVNSQQLFRQAVDEGIRPEKITIIPNGVELPEFDEQLIRQAVRDELHIPAASLFVLSVGRLRFEKGHTFLLKAIPAVLEQVPDTIFAIAGDGTLRTDLETEARTLSIEKSVHFLGNRADARRLMTAADLFVLPSRSEGMPNALLEAMGLGTVAISTRVGGAEDIIETASNGYLVPPEDSRALAKAIIDLLTDSNLRRKMAAAGRETVLKYYSLDSMCRKFRDLLDVENQKEN